MKLEIVINTYYSGVKSMFKCIRDYHGKLKIHEKSCKSC